MPGLLRELAHVRKARSPSLRRCPGVAVVTPSGPPHRARNGHAHGSGESENLSPRPEQMLISKQFWSTVGARAPWGVACPGGGCEVQVQAGRRYRVSGQAGLSCGSMPCWRSRARSRSISSVSCWHCSARSGRARICGGPLFLPCGLAGQQFLLPVTKRRSLLIPLEIGGATPLEPDLVDLEIGRASCRERV